MLYFEILILEFGSVDGFPSSPIMISEITSLKHEFRDNSVEATSLIAESFLMGAKLSEVFCCFGNDLVKEVKGESACCLTTDGDVHEYL